MSAEIEQVTLAVAAINKVEAGLNALRVSYEGVVFEVTTTAGLESAKAARAEIREPRYEVERIRKAAKAPLLAIGKRLDSEAARITAELEKIEGPIHSQIIAEEARKEAEKKARIDAEIARGKALRERVEELRGNQLLTPASGSVLIADHIADIEAIMVDATFEEFEEEAGKVKLATLARFCALHTAAETHEAEQRRLAAERAEVTRMQTEQAERNRLDAIERAKQEEADRAKRVADARAHAEQIKKDRERIAKDEADAKAKIDAERAENDRKAAERQAELDAQAEVQRLANAAEAKRLADQQAEIDRQQAALVEAQKPTPVIVESATGAGLDALCGIASRPAGMTDQELRQRYEEKPRARAVPPPPREEMIDAIARHFDVDRPTALYWLLSFRSIEEAA